jgi:hypothetical protein
MGEAEWLNPSERDGSMANGCRCRSASVGVDWLAEPERFNWIGRAGCVFFRKSFVVRSLRAFHRPAPRSRLVLRKNSQRHHFPVIRLCPLRLRPECRCRNRSNSFSATFQFIPYRQANPIGCQKF